jgi:hypothetical protein
MSLEKIIELSNHSKYYEDLYDIFWKLYEHETIQPRHYKGIRVGLFNIPCAGFGDVILCKSFYDFIKKWYRGINVTICTTAPEKYNDLGVKGQILTLKTKNKKGPNECIDFDKLKYTSNIKFDIMIVVPVINKTFEIKKFKKLIPFANVFNTFTMSEYNGQFPPNTFPIGVGKGQLGMMINDFKYKQQTLMKKPYALVYIAEGIGHANYCFYAYLEMVCKKYKKYKKFEIVIPAWISEDLMYYPVFIRKVKSIVSPHYKNIMLVTKENEDVPIVLDVKHTSSVLTFRADILPQKREIFISLMKDSVPDILVTGDQSITDVISCCKNHKTIWYQIAPWKKGFADSMFTELPNKYYKSFKTSCGSLKSFTVDIEWKEFFKQYDFGIHGKRRMDSILIANYEKDDTTDKLLTMIEKSRYLDSAQTKIKKLRND